MAFAARPAVIVLDEPTTGLDVATQAHVLETIRSLASLHGVAALYVTHDLAVVATLADRVAVLYAGRVVEQASTAEIFSDPAHPGGERQRVAIARVLLSKPQVLFCDEVTRPSSPTRMRRDDYGCAMMER